MGKFCARRAAPRKSVAVGANLRREEGVEETSGGGKVLDISLFVRHDAPRVSPYFAPGGEIMTIGQSMLPEFDQEMQNTRKTLERVPEDKWGWKPHEKSGTVGWLASHIGTVPGWITMTINTDELDYAPVGGPGYEPPKITNRKELLAAFDKESAEARAALAGVSD